MAFSKSLLEAKHELGNNLASNQSAQSKMERLSGKITDKRGWYLPFIYLDAVMDLVPSYLMDEEINKVLDNNPNEKVIERMKDFFGYFENNCGEIGPPKKTLEYVAKRKDAYFYGFSEKLSQIMQLSNDEVTGFKVLLPPFNDVANKTTHLLYTDAIVINQMEYNKAGMDTKNAIFEFIKFFASNPTFYL